MAERLMVMGKYEAARRWWADENSEWELETKENFKLGVKDLSVSEKQKSEAR